MLQDDYKILETQITQSTPILPSSVRFSSFDSSSIDEKKLTPLHLEKFLQELKANQPKIAQLASPMPDEDKIQKIVEYLLDEKNQQSFNQLPIDEANYLSKYLTQLFGSGGYTFQIKHTVRGFELYISRKQNIEEWVKKGGYKTVKKNLMLINGSWVEGVDITVKDDIRDPDKIIQTLNECRLTQSMSSDFVNKIEPVAIYTKIKPILLRSFPIDWTQEDMRDELSKNDKITLLLIKQGHRFWLCKKFADEYRFRWLDPGIIRPSLPFPKSSNESVRFFGLVTKDEKTRPYLVSYTHSFVAEIANKDDIGQLIDNSIEMSKVRFVNIITMCYSSTLALRHVHQFGVIHQDVKPGNFLLFEDKNQDIWSKIMDFGIAEEEKSKTKYARGSACYFSPAPVKFLYEEKDPDFTDLEYHQKNKSFNQPAIKIFESKKYNVAADAAPHFKNDMWGLAISLEELLVEYLKSQPGLSKAITTEIHSLIQLIATKIIYTDQRGACLDPAQLLKEFNDLLIKMKDKEELHADEIIAKIEAKYAKHGLKISPGIVLDTQSKLEEKNQSPVKGNPIITRDHPEEINQQSSMTDCKSTNNPQEKEKIPGLQTNNLTDEKTRAEGPQSLEIPYKTVEEIRVYAKSIKDDPSKTIFQKNIATYILDKNQCSLRSQGKTGYSTLFAIRTILPHNYENALAKGKLQIAYEALFSSCNGTSVDKVKQDAAPKCIQAIFENSSMLSSDKYIIFSAKSANRLEETLGIIKQVNSAVREKINQLNCSFSSHPF